ncbi:polyprenyl synthetase family protein [Paenisporosarcina quisquiliarum]|uniref:Farnesyl diphosphate synthase n=1 Tax=Paenisporosarcina quisquiliarum TaxID=365346 RepID=A0A9X3REV1_9BACL|nr:farnesyl diphosphate synthase [Paenisporosarcina quisquiliarum]MCZ8537962.1 polyprenyl synthetase family protein [Paenisporosarcina quisquiliarum]
MTFLQTFTEVHIPKIDQQLTKQIQSINAPDILKEAMNYSLAAGGKRVRPLFLLAVLDFFKVQHSEATTVGAAIEMIHTYSLIHDDLPSMDNDDFRRGKLTNHKVYGDAMAILAGDGLLTYSFGVLSRLKSVSPDNKLELIQLMSEAAGAEGMVGGQVLDIESERKTISVEELETIHINKTGALLTFSIVAGAILASADAHAKKALKDFGFHIGLAFQIQDDILDIEGTTESLGKTAGKDVASEKNTYPALLTLDGAKMKRDWHYNQAIESLRLISSEPGLLDELAAFIVNRNK